MDLTSTTALKLFFLSCFAKTSCMVISSNFSVWYVIPLFISFTRSSDTSTPITSLPLNAKLSESGSPTYPSPNTTTF